MNNAPPHLGPSFVRDQDRDRNLDAQRSSRVLQQHIIEQPYPQNLHPQEETMAHRERERDPRDHSRDPYPPQPPQSQQQGPPGAPHHSSAGSIPIHQPVASRISGAIHSPNGLLANHGAGAGGAPPPQMGGPPPQGAASGYGGPPPTMHNGAGDPTRPHPSMQEQQQPPMYSMMQHNGTSVPTNGSGPPPGFGGPLQPDNRGSQAPPPYGNCTNCNGHGPHTHGPPPGPGVPQGQQPILNVRFQARVGT